jgi:Fe2+ transport system protein B
MGQEAFPILVALGPAIASAVLGLFIESRRNGVLRALVRSFMESRHRVQILQSTLIAAAFFGPTISGWVNGLQNSETIILSVIACIVFLSLAMLLASFQDAAKALDDERTARAVFSLFEAQLRAGNWSISVSKSNDLGD